LHQSRFQTACHDLLKQLLKQLRLLETTVTILGERGVVRNLLVEPQSRKPAPRQMHAQFLHQLALTGNAVQIADQQDAQQKLGIDRRTAGIAITRFQLFAHKGKTDVLFDQPQQMRLRNLTSRK